MSVSFQQTSTPTERVSFYDSETVCGRGIEHGKPPCGGKSYVCKVAGMCRIARVPLLRASGVWG